MSLMAEKNADNKTVAETATRRRKYFIEDADKAGFALNAPG
jgi:hypothetical protein